MNFFNDEKRREKCGKTTTRLGDCVERTIDVEDALWVAWNGFGYHDFGPALVTNLVDVLAASADDNGGVLGYDEAAHVDVRRRYGGCARGRGARG